MQYNKLIDHTLLKQDASPEQIVKLCEEAKEFHFMSVCVNPAYVPLAAQQLKGSDVKVCTVIGFPLGMNLTKTKVEEAELAIKEGADEIDMVIHVGALKDKKYDDILKDIKSVKTACEDKVLKVIIETCLLTDEEKIKMCEIVNESGADYIKTSTGFSKGGATKEDVALFAKYVKAPVKIKAAGGIASLEDAEDFIKLGADRLGTSRIVKIVKSME